MTLNKFNTWFAVIALVLVLAGVFGGFFDPPEVFAGGREGQPRTIFIDTTASPRSRVSECLPQANRFIRYNVGDEIILATDNGRGERDSVLETFVVERVAFPKSWGTHDRGDCYLPHSRAEQVVYMVPKVEAGD